MSRPLVWFIPGEDGPIVCTKDHWGADFYGETAVFPTKEQAVDFCRRRWGRTDPVVRGPQ